MTATLSSPAPSKGRGGRPRDPSRDVAIREAVFSVLASDGYVGMTMDNVAAYASTGKATIYRRWSTREALITDVLGGLPKPDRTAVTGMVTETDLLIMLRQYANVLTGSYGEAAAAVVTAPVPAIRTAILTWHAEWHRAFSYVWQDAADRDECADDEVDVLVEATTGPLVQRWLLGGPLDDAFLVALVEALIGGHRA